MGKPRGNSKCSGKAAADPMREVVNKWKNANFLCRRKIVNFKNEFLNQKQALVYNFVKTHIENKTEVPLRLIVLGVAGTGKSYLVKGLEKLFRKTEQRYRIFGPTGVSAFNVDGDTIHSGFCMNKNYRRYAPNDNASILRGPHNSVKYYIFDEVSMIGCHLFGFISQRLSSAMDNHESMAGKSIILLGDLAQLAPVADYPLFRSVNLLKNISLIGAQLYQEFKKVAILTEPMRQNGDGEEQIAFRALLLRARIGKLTFADLKLLRTRKLENLDKNELEDFNSEKCINIFAHKTTVHTHNEEVIKAKGVPLLTIHSVDTIPLPEELKQKLTICVGARVMLTQTVWKDAGLYNNSIGTVVEINFDKNDKSPEDKLLPSTVFVNFDTYLGPKVNSRKDLAVPIVPKQSAEYCAEYGMRYKRLMIPLRLAYGATVHRVQGLSLPKAVIDIQDFPTFETNPLFARSAKSLIFVALSRVKQLRDLAFRGRVPKSILDLDQGGFMPAWQKEEMRLTKLHI